MNAQWTQIKQSLATALDLDLSEREEYIVSLPAEVRSEIESLLAFENEADDGMQLSAVEFSKEFAEDGDSLIGHEFGPYRAVLELGLGGMGAVYLAERIDGKFEQKVALKLLKREMNTSELRRHFELEREILASLQHPNIARLLDAGTTDDRIPYFAMEYVDGVPIDDYANQNKLDLKARLELFRTVCSAVEYAHRNLVIHRDLKPSNILVTRDGVPKLLDFGISKIISKGYEPDSSATITQLGVMTPAYASPEQLRRESVTTLSDVYSLGVILFELLSNHRPFEAKEGNVHEIYSAVLNQDPPTPSSLATTDIPHKPDASRPRSDQDVTEPIKNRNTGGRKTASTSASVSAHSIRGDLDNIVLKALRKEPERRYESAGHLSQDVGRHMDGLPITARPNTLSYRAGKFISRNRLGVGAASIVILAVIAGVIATLWQSRVAQAERARAEKRFNDVRVLANSFILEISPKIENLPGSTPARQLLITRALEYLNSLSQEKIDDPQLRAELAKAYEKVGDVQGGPYNPNIGDTTGAMSSYEKSLAIREELLSAEPTNIGLKGELAHLYRLVAQLHSTGADNALAVGFCEKAIEFQQAVVDNDPTNADARFSLGQIYRQRGILYFYDNDNKTAIQYYEKARAEFDRLAKEHPENAKYLENYAYSFTNIGEALGWDNDFKGAAIELEKGLNMLLQLEDKLPNDLDYQRSLLLAHNKRAENLQDLEQFDASVEMFKKGLAVAERMLAIDPQSVLALRDVAMTSKKTAQALSDAKKHNEAVAMLNRSIDMFKRISIVDPANTGAPYDVANTRLSLGKALLARKEFAAALPILSRSEIEFAKVLEKNPDNLYAKRMSSHAFDALGICYLELSKISGKAEDRKNAVQKSRQAIDTLKNLESTGNLGDVDRPLLVELENRVAHIESQAGKS